MALRTQLRARGTPRPPGTVATKRSAFPPTPSTRLDHGREAHDHKEEDEDTEGEHHDRTARA